MTEKSKVTKKWYIIMSLLVILATFGALTAIADLTIPGDNSFGKAYAMNCLDCGGHENNPYQERYGP